MAFFIINFHFFKQLVRLIFRKLYSKAQFLRLDYLIHNCYFNSNNTYQLFFTINNPPFQAADLQLFE